MGNTISDFVPKGISVRGYHRTNKKDGNKKTGGGIILDEMASLYRDRSNQTCKFDMQQPEGKKVFIFLQNCPKQCMKTICDDLLSFVYMIKQSDDNRKLTKSATKNANHRISELTSHKDNKLKLTFVILEESKVDIVNGGNEVFFYSAGETLAIAADNTFFKTKRTDYCVLICGETPAAKVKRDQQFFQDTDKLEAMIQHDIFTNGILIEQKGEAICQIST